MAPKSVPEKVKKDNNNDNIKQLIEGIDNISINSTKCSKCGEFNELAKGKKFCKICKNAYERERKKNLPDAKRDEINEKNRLYREAVKNETFVKIKKDLDSNKCSKCNEIKELAKGKPFCKDCKNSYERERRKNLSEDKKNDIKKKNKELYEKKKLEAVNVEIIRDINILKLCSKCNKEKPQNEFHIQKTKGNIRSSCIECNKEKRSTYYEENKDKIIKQTTEYTNERMKNDPVFKFIRRQRNRIYTAFKNQGENKSNKSLDLINCTSLEFLDWINYQLDLFESSGMTLENYGKYWHLDHVIPSIYQMKMKYSNALVGKI